MTLRRITFCAWAPSWHWRPTGLARCPVLTTVWCQVSTPNCLPCEHRLRMLKRPLGERLEGLWRPGLFTGTHDQRRRSACSRGTAVRVQPVGLEREPADLDSCAGQLFERRLRHPLGPSRVPEFQPVAAGIEEVQFPASEEPPGRGRSNRRFLTPLCVEYFAGLVQRSGELR